MPSCGQNLLEVPFSREIWLSSPEPGPFLPCLEELSAREHRGSVGLITIPQSVEGRDAPSGLWLRAAMVILSGTLFFPLPPPFPRPPFSGEGAILSVAVLLFFAILMLSY